MSSSTEKSAHGGSQPQNAVYVWDIRGLREEIIVSYIISSGISILYILLLARMGYSINEVVYLASVQAVLAAIIAYFITRPPGGSQS